MSRFLRVPFTVLLLALLATQLAQAEEPNSAAGNPAGYYAARFIEHAVDRYYRAFGELPADWQAVVDSGVYSHALIGPAGETLDPDDGQLDFPGDAYLKRSGNFFALVSLSPDGSQTRRILRAGETYVQQFERIRLTRRLVPEHDRRLRRYENEPAKLLQFAQIGQLNEAITDFHGYFGRYPDSMDELFASGFCPLADAALNPVTGEPYRYDGSPGDLRLNAAQQFSAVLHVDSDGLLSTSIEY
ncbi:hypothetical protein KDL44_11960 [bacterium]|nr:hypothetical protein [bacterium]